MNITINMQLHEIWQGGFIKNEWGILLILWFERTGVLWNNRNNRNNRNNILVNILI